MEKKTILLVCSAGMSTSLLVSRMEKAAEKRDLDIDIAALSASEAENHLSSKNVDVILLGPQVRYMQGQFEKKVAGQEIEVAVIDMRDYGLVDGEKVLDTALAKIK